MLASDAKVEDAGAPVDEVEVTPEMIEDGLVWLYAFNPEMSDGKDTVREIIKSALANFHRLHRLVG
jgi:hypothetical protein